MRRFVVLLLALTSPASVFAVTAEETLQKDISTANSILQQELGDADWDATEARLESLSDFFPDDGIAPDDVRQEDPAFSKFVTVRIMGVPYALTDVPVGQWFAPYVRDMAERGIVSGYKDQKGIPTGVFAPAKSVTLEELAKMVIEASGMDPAACGTTVKNPLAKGSWSLPYIACAESLNFVLYADGTVDIRRPATRAEVVMTLMQAFGVQLKDLTPDQKLFTDVSASTLFAAAINTAVQDGIVAGYTDNKGQLTGEFGPANPVNRAEVCKMLSIALQVYGG